MLMTEYVPNISMPQKRVKILMPSKSKLSRSTRPKTAQNSVWVVSNRLRMDRKRNLLTNQREGETREIYGHHTRIEQTRKRSFEAPFGSIFWPQQNKSMRTLKALKFACTQCTLTWQISSTQHTHSDLRCRSVAASYPPFPACGSVSSPCPHNT